MNRDPVCSRNRGAALILSVLLLVFVGGLAGTLLIVQFHRNRLKSDYIGRIGAFYGAEGAANYAAELIWNGFLQAHGGQPGKFLELRAYLDDNAIASVPPGVWTAVPLAALDLGRSDATAAVDVLRTDGTGFTDLRYRAVVAIGNQVEVVESSFRAEGGIFNGFQFAIYSNNVSCTFCHAHFSSVKKFAGGPYDRVRVAATDSLVVRSTAASTIAGTLYTRGLIMDKTGVILSDLAATTFDGYTIAGGQIDPSTATLVDLYAAPVDADGNPVPGYNLYMNYPDDSAKQTDGRLPSDFPPVFFDENSNRVIDGAEYSKVAADAAGSVSGLGFIIPAGGVFGGASLSTTDPVSASGAIDGNLILTGTAGSPIRLSGKVVVNGDVVIKGVVQGLGSIIARGNIYVAGDVVYNDQVAGGKRQFGVAPDGSLNGLALSAGGNVLIGDYLTPKNGSLTSTASLMTGTSADGFGFTLSQLSLYNRREWQRTQSQLPGSGGTMVANSTYTPGYVPKYYAIQASNPIWAFISKVTWDDAKKSWIGSEHAGSFTDLTSLAVPVGALVSTLDPSSPWITPVQLKQFWIEDESQRASGDPFKIDGLIYTDNSVFALARGVSMTGGTMAINGALVARDTGILVPNNLEINYDERAVEFLDVRDSTEVTYHRASSVRRTEDVLKQYAEGSLTGTSSSITQALSKTLSTGYAN
ncbi:MAG: hypothetical protein HY717_00925 [Planctomycetes bacterium]|nr:hypothetical protein [Planctomycetota bacterium]